MEETPVLFLHGWGTDSKSFAAVSRFFFGAYKCIFVDFDCNPEKVMTLEDYAEVVEKRLIAECVTRVNIIAHSFGCRVAVLLASRNPHMIRRMVLTGAAGLKPRFSLLVWSKIRLYKLFGIGHGSYDYARLSPTGKRTFQNIIRRDLASEISRLNTAVLLIWGKNDKTTPIYMANRWQKLYAAALRYSIKLQTEKPRCILKVYTDAGHFAFADAPERFIGDAYGFLEEKC